MKINRRRLLSLLGVSPAILAGAAGLLYNFTPLTFIFGAVAVLDPLVANDLVALGYDKKEKLLDWLQKNATRTVADAKTMLFTGGAALRGLQAASLKDDDLIPRWPNTALINVVLVGGQPLLSSREHELCTECFDRQVDVNDVPYIPRAISPHLIADA